jgi:hypothetical protein
MKLCIALHTHCNAFRSPGRVQISSRGSPVGSIGAGAPGLLRAGAGVGLRFQFKLPSIPY